jgi:hypothetical protein
MDDTEIKSLKLQLESLKYEKEEIIKSRSALLQSNHDYTTYKQELDEEITKLKSRKNKFYFILSQD